MVVTKTSVPTNEVAVGNIPVTAHRSRPVAEGLVTVNQSPDRFRKDSGVAVDCGQLKRMSFPI